MDQFISANGAEDHALLLDCRDLSFRLAPIPANVALVIANTMVKHSVAGGEYTSRRAEVEEAAAVIARHRPEVRFLRDATVEDLAQVGRGDEPECAEARAPRDHRKHAHGGRRRCADSSRSERTGPPDGRGARELQQDFEASCVEADAMVTLAQDLPGLIGARLTGGGFGGCTINLVEQERPMNSPRRWPQVTPAKRESFRRFTFAMHRAARTRWSRALSH